MWRNFVTNFASLRKESCNTCKCYLQYNILSRRSFRTKRLCLHVMDSINDWTIFCCEWIWCELVNKKREEIHKQSQNAYHGAAEDCEAASKERRPRCFSQLQESTPGMLISHTLYIPRNLFSWSLFLSYHSYVIHTTRFVCTCAHTLTSLWNWY